MAAGKKVKDKIKSIKNTQKITSAMEMVAASKMRRTQELMKLGKPYARHIRSVIGNLAHVSSEYQHPYLEQRDISGVGYIVVSSDRGLCGGLNINTFKRVIEAVQKWRQQEVSVDFCAIGAKAINFFSAHRGNLLGAVRDIGDVPSLEHLLGIVKIMLAAYDEAKIDRIYLVFNEFVSTLVQKPVTYQLVPLPPSDDTDIQHHWDYIYEPDDAKQLMISLMTRYVESQVYQAVVENKASEMASRMIAMKNASDNAGKFIDELQLLYNKARQAAITQELSEIVSGAAAL